LDKNYLFLAQKKGVQILAEQQVVDVEPIENQNGEKGYRITTQSSTHILARKQKFITKGVIFSGGVLGTLLLLLKLKKSSLANLSDQLGDQVRTNNETLISVCTTDKTKDLSKGIAIGSILQTDENSFLEVVRYGKGSGFWKLLHIPFTCGRNCFLRMGKMGFSLIKSFDCYFKIYFINNWSKRTAILLFMQNLDSTLKFRRTRLGNLATSITSGDAPTPFIKESIEITQKYGEAVHGKPTSSLLETIAGIPTTAHLLGGAVMGSDPKHGVIDSTNRVFGYQNMYIIDGSMISSNPGVNPSLSILAIAERAMTFIPEKLAN
jgi:cholesterol oxidase